MWKKAGELKRGDIWIDRVGTFWPVENVVEKLYGNEHWVEVGHPKGASHSFRSDNIVEYI